MEDFTLTTPALLFPAISLLMLAYTNRFVVLAGLIRELYARYQEDSSEKLEGQIVNLQLRINIIKYMQIFGAFSFFFCVVCMFLIFAGSQTGAYWLFALSLVLLLVSLALLIWELQLSVGAIQLQVEDVRSMRRAKRKP